MELKFLGIGSCFTNDHTSAFFITKKRDLVLLDCSNHTFSRLIKDLDLNTCRNVYVYITHTHADHISGLPILIHYAHFALNKKITVVAPSTVVGYDIKTLLKLEGVESFMYTLTVAFDFITALITKEHSVIPNEALGFSVPTEHVKPLADKCFGYIFNINGKKIIYTGDTATINPFLPHIKNAAELYVDVSVRYQSDAHLWFKDVLPLFKSFVQHGTKVYLMHVDNVSLAKKLVENVPGIDVVRRF